MDVCLMKWWWQHPPRVESEPFHAERAGAPRILVSLDRSWQSRLRISLFLFSRLIRRAGGEALRVDYGTGPEPECLETDAARLLDAADALLLTGGDDVDPDFYRPGAPARRTFPRRDRFELALIAQARARGLPILGVCRGCQLLNVAYGGTLRSIREDARARRAHHRVRPHPVEFVEGSRLASIVGQPTVRVRSLHGQIVDELGERLRIAALAPDGLPEAIEVDGDEFVVGVQWHPEFMIFDRAEHRIVTALVEAARSSAAARRGRASPVASPHRS